MTFFLLPRYQTSYIDKDFQKQIVSGQSHVNINRLAETVSAVTQPQVSNCSSLFLSFSPTVYRFLSFPESLFIPPFCQATYLLIKTSSLINLTYVCVLTQVPQTDLSSNEFALPSPLDGVSNRELLVKYSLRHPASLQVDFTSSR